MITLNPPPDMIDHPSWHPQPYAEIVKEDLYLLRDQRPPETVYDLGGHRGCFAAYCKALWPACRVVSVEPLPDNYRLWRESTATLRGVVCEHAAIANGPVYWLPGPNAGGHTFISPSVGHQEQDLRARVGAPCEVPGITLGELLRKHPPRGVYYIKMDIEAGEQCLFGDEEAMAILLGADYLAAELHFFAAAARQVPLGPRSYSLMPTHGHVIGATLEWMYQLTEAHDVEVRLRENHAIIWCTKRKR